MNLKEALKAALDGKRIRNRRWTDGYFVRWDSRGFMDSEQLMWQLPANTDLNLEIVPEPLKYSVDVWFKNEPKLAGKIEISSHLFGEYGAWSHELFDGGKKYRITVEEVEE